VLRADPRHANGAAVVIAPGGGHYLLVVENEGMVPARMLNRIGVTAFVLKYRLAHGPDSAGYTVAGDGAADLRRAVRWVRAHAAEYGVDPQRVGVMGFSAGGELVSLVADNPEPPRRGKTDALDRLSARPDFQVLVYPGDAGTPAQAAGTAPPAFLVAGSRDKCCAAPTLALYQQLAAAGVSAELHMYADSDHAFNMGQRGERVSLQHWPDRLADWLRLYRNQGMRERYRHEILGYNYRLTDIAAAIGLCQLDKLERNTARRQALAARYDAGFADLPVRTPVVPPGRTHVFHQYTLDVGAARDRIVAELAAAGIGVGIYYPIPVHRQKYVLDLGIVADLPVTDRAAAQTLSLPMYPVLSDEDQETVIAAVRTAVLGADADASGVADASPEGAAR